jgi:hypothetical protein
MYNGQLISDLIAAATTATRQWQAAKQRPTQFGDNKNAPSLTRAEIEDDMERDRR